MLQLCVPGHAVVAPQPGVECQAGGGADAVPLLPPGVECVCQAT